MRPRNIIAFLAQARYQASVLNVVVTVAHVAVDAGPLGERLESGALHERLDVGGGAPVELLPERGPVDACLVLPPARQGLVELLLALPRRGLQLQLEHLRGLLVGLRPGGPG
eukprot:1704225-Pyramimonas_sp.AAC.1